MNRITVVAALIEREGHLLVCQRKRTAIFPLLWEFPGGKVHDGELPEQALVRELAEELDITVCVGPELYRTRHRYPELPEEIELRFFAAHIVSGAPRNLAFEQIAWVRPQDLPAMEFLPADRELIARLAEGRLRTDWKPSSAP
ncbi:MAG: (deoxy)nucleoside triphosphate pyrophosphohydrolase [Acidobacteriia bacterium]|jgi:8-oxo-dGTP diphosphatase|nr:(deoxy)nucleoside triphosphate pyrophosphohydrolase [Terriglobia bacterium]